MVKLQEISDAQHMVTVPVELRKAMGWDKGTELTFRVVDDTTLELKEK